MHETFILAIDAGTSGIRTVLFNEASEEVAYTYREFTQITRAPGLLEHDPIEILNTVVQTMTETLATANMTATNVAAIGIATQRGTVIAWDKATGKPVYNAIVWQDLRTNERCEELSKLLGLTISPNAGYTKYEWLLNNVPHCRERVEAGDVLIGTLDSWLIWHLTGGQAFITDISNAVVTNMWNPLSGEWIPELANLIGMPVDRLATIMPSRTIYGETAIDHFPGTVPITAISGDQQAAMFGHLATNPGDGKATYGTSVMVNVNTGKQWIPEQDGLYSLALWRNGKEDFFCLEGTIITGGATIDWARSLQLFASPDEMVNLAATVPNSSGVTFIPALQGLGTPYREPLATGAMLGLTRATTRAHIARALLEAIAFRTCQVIEALRKNSPAPAFSTLQVDGGMARSDFFLQLQADVLGIPIERPPTIQVTALGIAYMAGLAIDYWPSIDSIRAIRPPNRVFTPNNNNDSLHEQYSAWVKTVESVRDLKREELLVQNNLQGDVQ